MNAQFFMRVPVDHLDEWTRLGWAELGRELYQGRRVGVALEWRGPGEPVVPAEVKP